MKPVLAEAEKSAFTMARMAVREPGGALDIVRAAMIRLVRGYAGRLLTEYAPGPGTSGARAFPALATPQPSFPCSGASSLRKCSENQRSSRALSSVSSIGAVFSAASMMSRSWSRSFS